MANRNFQRAKANKNDEFYTQLKDIVPNKKCESFRFFMIIELA